MAIRSAAADLAVMVLLSADKIPSEFFRDQFTASILAIPSKIAEADQHINVMERCKMLEHVRSACCVAATQAEIGGRAKLIDESEAANYQTIADEIGHNLHQHIRKIRGEFQDRRGKTAPFV